jgi:hypothetical protein
MDPFIIIFTMFPFLILALLITFALLYYSTDDYFIGIVISKTKEYYYVDNIISKNVVKCKSNKEYQIGDRVTAFRKYLTWYLV